MARVTNRFVVHRVDAAAIGIAERAQAARCIECFVQFAIDLDLFEAFQRQYVNFSTIDYADAKVSVFIDDAVGRPCQ